MNRRAFFGLLAAPAIIRVADLMPVRTVLWTPPKRILILTELIHKQLLESMQRRAMIRAMEDRWLLALDLYHGAYQPGDTIKFRRPPIFDQPTT